MVRALGPCKVLDLKLRRWASHRKVAGKTAAQRFFLVEQYVGGVFNKDPMFGWCTWFTFNSFVFFWSFFCLWSGKSLAEVGDQIAKAFPKVGCARELECTGAMGRPGQVGWPGQQVECQCKQLECPGWVATSMWFVLFCETWIPKLSTTSNLQLLALIFPGPRRRRLATRANSTVEASENDIISTNLRDGYFFPRGGTKVVVQRGRGISTKNSGKFCQVKMVQQSAQWKFRGHQNYDYNRSSSSEYVPFIFDLHQDGLRKQLQENWTRFFSESGCHHRRASRIHQEPLRYEAGACKMPGFGW